ncbi:HET-domain-containing protein [Neurospora crassa]|uniref:Heterokaryon incompatibility domain-containing protein n=2 Tax=Neurospora crassa TaxID=5141 RepID=Q7SAM2_NEUCR|nr:hypothetical protein NCU08019 [Neurospora crassa OR74A]EAA33453.2 hypothetical protein NCU08019 [Neurospora crassa OR74A]KHE84415.1 HET-domain-containing protein [Neurospora crassa]|eukprot:XP_962689.2 hypothetical protein NCU08019 [Neurospora crassa OR74A]
MDNRQGGPDFWSTKKNIRDLYFEPTTTTEKCLYLKMDDKSSAANAMMIPPRIEIQPSSALPKAKEWLERCINTHSNCPKPGGLVPTRLLSLSTSTEAPEPRLHLQLASESAKSVPYAALSYCWGRNQKLKLEMSSLDRFRTTGIGMEELHRTIADAVMAVLSLGLRHMWVDALCIIQDSDEDKAREIGNMGAIYAAATVTLAVSGAASVDDGFLCKRSLGNLGLWSFEIPTQTARTSLQIPVTDAGAGKREKGKFSQEANVEPKTTTALLLHKSPNGGQIRWIVQNASPLYTRAWTYQERLLSARILDVGVIQTRWWCPETPSSGPKARQDHNVDGWKHLTEVLDNVAGSQKCWEVHNQRSSASTHCNTPARSEGPRQITGLDTTEHVEIMKTWSDTVEQYTGRNISFQEDRLPALSMIAQCVQARTGYQYAAGLWMEDMLVALLWSRYESKSRRNARKDSDSASDRVVYCGPTWSWASVHDKVSCFPYEATVRCTYCKVLDLHIEPKPGGNAFGGLSSAALVLSGLMKPAFWRQDLSSSASSTVAMPVSSDPPASSEAASVEPPKGALYTTHITGTEQRLQKIHMRFDTWRPEFEVLAYLATSDNVRAEQPLAIQLDVYLVVICKYAFYDDEDSDCFFEGLVLQRNMCGDYIRLGSFAFNYKPRDLKGDDLAAFSAIEQWLTSGDEETIRLI